MARITVTIPPEMYPVSGSLFQKAIPLIYRVPSTTGSLILGFDKNFRPITIGKVPPRVTYDPWILISEDSEYLLIAEDSIFADKFEITAFIRADGTGNIVPVDSNQKPIISTLPNINNYPDKIFSPDQLLNLNKLSTVGLFTINAPIGSKLSYSLSDITTKNINLYGSYYSVNFGSTWIPYNNLPIQVPSTSYGVVFISVSISQETQNIGNEDLIFLLTASIPDDINYLTAEFGDNPNPASKGQVLSNYVILQRKIPNKKIGNQSSPIPYGTFNKCLNNSGLAEFYGDSSISINGGTISYNYQYYTGIYPLCIK